MDLSRFPDQLLAAASEALHEACCGGGGCDDPRFAELDQLGHRHDALVVLDAVWARLQAATLRWAATRIRTECSIRWDDDCCSRCHEYASQLDGWADAVTKHHPATHPDPGPHEEARR